MNASAKNAYRSLLETVEHWETDAIINHLIAQFPDAVTFSSSFSYEDQVITHLIANKAVSIFTLDTGRLFKETYATWQATIENSGKKIAGYFPDATAIQDFVTRKGPDAFYQSVENRQQCCYLRKVAPLKEALKGNAVWITGLRKEHSPEREHLSPLEWDEENQMIKYHPLLYWSFEAVKAYVHTHRLPYNILQDHGYVSIGCAPCTRAIQPGEDFRAGRWWWEDNSKKECGLHLHQK